MKFKLPAMRIPDLHLAENSSLMLVCALSNIFNIDNFNKSIHVLYANGSETQLLSTKRKHFVVIDKVIYFQKEKYDHSVIICLITNTGTNESFKAEVKLRHREQSRITDVTSSLLLPVALTMSLPMICMIIVTGSCYFWTHRGRKMAVPKRKGSRNDSHIYEQIQLDGLGKRGAVAEGGAGEPRSASPVSNDYEEVYDVMYEERLRIQRLQKQLQQLKETAAPPPPPPPPVNTIPVQESAPLPSHIHQLLPPDSAVSPADLYLLKLDSDGYEIPDELKFIPLRNRADDYQPPGTNQLQMESQPARETSERFSPLSTFPLPELLLSSPRVHQLPPDSAISPEDLYLLKLDSDGYEIPDELKFIPLPNKCDENT